MRHGPAYRRYLADMLRDAAHTVTGPDPAAYGLDPETAEAARAEFTRDLDRQASIIDPPRRFASA